jgi:MFS family permease
MIAAFLYVVSMILIAKADSFMSFLIASGLFGIGVGFNAPTAFAWTIDLSSDEHRGRGMATAFIALEIGIGIGAILSARIYNNMPENFPIAFIMAAFVALAALIYLFLVRNNFVPQKSR